MLGKALTTAAAGAAGGAAGVLGIEDVFSTWLYDGNSSTQTITNGIDLAGEGGMTWIKTRSTSSNNNIHDTERGATGRLITDSTGAEVTLSAGVGVTSFNSDGFSLGTGSSYNGSSTAYVSWTFRKAEKFFDVVTYTGTGSAQNISHNLGSVPGCIIVKNADGDTNWEVYHRALDATSPEDYRLELNQTGPRQATSGVWNDTAPTSSVFTAGVDLSNSGDTYVAYLFAHDAGGFGDGGTESVIKCGTFTGNTTVNLGWEPQWILIKPTSTTGNWDLHDNMRGWPASGDAQRLKANVANTEDATSQIYPNATGFSTLIGSATYVYIAIRRGPMKTPTDATEVFDVVARTSTNPNLFNTALSYVDSAWNRIRTLAGDTIVSSRLTGTGWLRTNQTTDESTATTSEIEYDYNNKINPYFWSASVSEINWLFRRAPGFFDVVAYTGTGSATTVSHNLGVAPEFIIVKSRSAVRNWICYVASRGNNGGIYLNLTNAWSGGSDFWNNTTPTSSVFSVGPNTLTNNSSETYIAYLFATCPGVSKVGSYTGTGTTLDVNCGFSAGARFVLIKRTDSTGDWYVWDTARGIVSGNDPYLLLNSNAAEVTNTDYIDPLSSGFQISSTAPAAINALGGSFIFLAIA